jgi:hypothetical protein
VERTGRHYTVADFPAAATSPRVAKARRSRPRSTLGGCIVPRGRAVLNLDGIANT